LQTDSYRGRRPSRRRRCAPARRRPSTAAAAARRSRPRTRVARAGAAAGGRLAAPRVAAIYYAAAAEPDQHVRPSRRTRENTHSKLFGADQPDSPRSAAAAFAAVQGLPPKPLQQRRVEDSQATLTLMRVRVDARRLAVRVGLTEQLGVGVSDDADGW